MKITFYKNWHECLLCNMRPSDFNLSFRANEESESLKYKTIKKWIILLTSLPMFCSTVIVDSIY